MHITDFTSAQVYDLWICTVTVTDQGTDHIITGHECPGESIFLDSCSCQHFARIGTCAHIAFARAGLNATAQAAYQERQAQQTAIDLDDNRRALDNLAYYLRHMVGQHIMREEDAA